MDSAFVSNLTYTRKIGDGPDVDVEIKGVEPFVVELRLLDAGDRAEIRDSLALEIGENDEQSVQARLGTIEILTVERAIVSWTLSPGPARATIARLRPDVLEAIRGETAYGRLPDKPAAEADEAAERQRAGLEEDELRADEVPATVPLPSSAGDGGDVS